MISKVFFILFVVCVVGSLSQGLLETNLQCAKNGAYCQNHWDCCSNSCLSYSYKCVRRNNPAIGGFPQLPSGSPIPISASNLGTATDDRNTLQNLIDSLFASTERPANYNVPPVDLDSRIGEDDTTTTFAPIESTTVLADCKVVGLKCFRDSECCTKRCHGFLHQCVT